MDYYRLGTHSRPVTTSSPEAQTWFDRGLIWLYGYNHEAAIVCFERALADDPDCAIAHWGIAYAVGPNYNKPWATFEPEERAASVERAQTSMTAALARADRQTPADRAMIEALAKRCPASPVEDFGPWNDAYAAAMRDVQRAHPNDLDIVKRIEVLTPHCLALNATRSFAEMLSPERDGSRAGRAWFGGSAWRRGTRFCRQSGVDTARSVAPNAAGY